MLSEPLDDVSEPDDVVSVIVHRKPFDDRNRNSASGGQDRKLVLGNRRVERSALLFPVRNELRQSGGLKAGAGQNVSADGGRFFDHANAKFVLAGLIGRLLEKK